MGGVTPGAPNIYFVPAGQNTGSWVSSPPSQGNFIPGPNGTNILPNGGRGGVVPGTGGGTGSSPSTSILSVPEASYGDTNAEAIALGHLQTNAGEFPHGNPGRFKFADKINNPNPVGAVPSNYNPTGVNLGNPQVATPGALATGPANPGIVTTNPAGYQVPGATTFPTAPTLAPATQGLFSTLGTNITADMSKQLEKTYGKGTAQAITQILATHGGFNPALAQSMIDAVEPLFKEHLNDILEAFGASGQRFGSTAALAAGKFGAQFTASQEQLTAQLYQWAYGNWVQALSSAFSKNKQSNIFGTIGNILSLVSSAGKGLGAMDIGGSGSVFDQIMTGLGAI